VSIWHGLASVCDMYLLCVYSPWIFSFHSYRHHHTSSSSTYIPRLQNDITALPRPPARLESSLLPHLIEQSRTESLESAPRQKRKKNLAQTQQPRAAICSSSPPSGVRSPLGSRHTCTLTNLVAEQLCQDTIAHRRVIVRDVCHVILTQISLSEGGRSPAAGKNSAADPTAVSAPGTHHSGTVHEPSSSTSPQRQ
jgi:hypothetical protein